MEKNTLREVEKVGQTDMSNIHLTDLISVEFLQSFQDAFSDALGMAALTTDKNGEPVTEGSNFTKFCMKLTRGCKEGLKRCKESDAYGGKESAITGQPAVYYCQSGLMDFAAPIIVNGEQIGSIIGGQILTQPPQKEKFLNIANELNVDEEEFLEALGEVEIVTEKQVRAAAQLLFIVASEISRMGYQRYMLKQMTSRLYDNVMHMMATIEELNASSTNVTDNQNSLDEEVKKITGVAKNINDLTKSIAVISDQTKMLGLNASIEAARAGEYGLGFGVVAKEIEKLSSESKNTVNKINSFTAQINDYIQKTSEVSASTVLITQEQEEATKSILEYIEDIASMSEQLKKLSSHN